jgi:hypothetical protein
MILRRSVLALAAISFVFPRGICIDDREALARVGQHQKANGLQQKIVLLDGQILDGVNRWQACLTLKPANEKLVPDLMFTEYKGPDPIAFVISANLKRRHLDVGQRAMIAAELATMRQGERTDKSPSPNSKSTETAAKELNVSPRSVVTGKAVRKADPPLADET